MDLRKPAKYHGLENQGATCYLNSVLQVLFMTEDFRESIKKSNAGNKRIDTELKELFEDLENYDAFTYKITNKLKIKNVYEQRDAAEHYEKIMRLTSPEASQIFHGELINYNTCQECNAETGTAAGFWSLPLPLVKDNNEYSVEKGIEDFFCPSVITGDDQMYCEICDKKCDAVLGCEVNHHPEVLVLLLKRFEFDYSSMTYVKINQPVNVPQTLQISEKHFYNLYAIVEHSGDLRYGHYVSIIRSQNDDEWYMFNDSMAPHTVSPTLERSQRAYLLFYRKQQKETQDNISNGINETPEKQQGPTETNQDDEGTSAKGTRKRHAPLDNDKEKDNKKPKEELSVHQGNETRESGCKGFGRYKGLPCSKTTMGNNKQVRAKRTEESDNTGQLTQMYPNQDNGGEDRFKFTPGFTLGFSDQNEQTELQIQITQVQNKSLTETLEASENTGQLSQLYPNQDNLGMETIVNADSKGVGEDESEFIPGFPLEFSNQNEQIVEIMETEITQVQKSGQVERQGCKQKNENCCDEVPQLCPDVTMTTEKQEQGSDQTEFFLHMDRTIGWTSENVYDKRQGLGAGGSPAEINNVIDKNVHKIDYSTDDTKSSELDALSTTRQPDSTAYMKLDEIKMNKSLALGESSCKKAYQKVEKGSDSDLDCTGDGISHRVHVELSKDSEFICGSEPSHNTQSMERLISVEGDKEKTGSYWKHNVGAAVHQSSDINALYKKNDPGYSPSVNQNNLRQSFLTIQKDEAEVEEEKNNPSICFEKLKITEKSELSFEGPQKAGYQIDADSSHAKPKKMLTKYDLYLDSIQNKSQTGRLERGKQIIENPPTQFLSVTEPECYRGGEYRERLKQERLEDDSCNVQKYENKEMTDNLNRQVMFRRMLVESCVVTREEDTEIYRITPVKKS